MTDFQNEFYSTLFLIGGLVWELLKTFWWLFLFLILWPKFSELWLWWRQELWSTTQDYVILEIKIPPEVRKPIKSMENVFASLWSIYEVPNWKEKWIDGKYQLSYSLEIVSIEGEIKFLIRVPQTFRKMAEVAIYSQYPDVEITEFPDYTESVPSNLPDNPNWDLWGCSFRTEKEDVYPIRTYKDFEPSEGGLPEEQERIDPLTELLEGLAGLKKGEQMWIQMVLTPVRNEQNNYQDRAKALIEKLFGREIAKEPKPQPIFVEAMKILLFGMKEKKEENVPPPPATLMRTPGELDVISAIESKISKKMHECHIRFIYLGEKEVFSKENVKIPIGFFNQFSTENLNGLRPLKPTVTSITHFMVNIRLKKRKRKIFRLYKKRATPTWPKSPTPGGLDGVFVLNTEELASLYHFPSQIVAPTPALPRVPTKRREAPKEVPKEE